MTDDPLPPLRQVIAEHGLAARKSLGQNFLLDLNLTRKIARMAGPLDQEDILEIGPGPGGLTRGLLMEGARRVVAVERDSRCIAALGQIADAFPDRLTVIEGDALEVDPAADLTPPIRIAANLPYNIGTELLTRWLDVPDWPPFWTSMTLMFQREVAQRITAEPGTKAYGRLSILAQWRCDVRIVMDLPPQAFTPPPKVASAVVRLDARAEPHFPADAGNLAALTRAGFGQRRKMLRSSLKSLSGDIEKTLKAAGIEPTARAENVDLESFCRLSLLL